MYSLNQKKNKKKHYFIDLFKGRENYVFSQVSTEERHNQIQFQEHQFCF